MIHTVRLKLVIIGNVDRYNVCFYAEMSTLRLTVCVMMQNGRYFTTVQEKTYLWKPVLSFGKQDGKPFKLFAHPR